MPSTASKPKDSPLFVLVLFGFIAACLVLIVLHYLTKPSIDRLPHSTDSFTQGLEEKDGKLVETTGLYGESKINVLDLKDGSRVGGVDLPGDVFGEGVTTHEDTMWVLTWVEGEILKYSWPELEPQGSIPLSQEGWGVCYGEEDNLWVSDGSHILRSLNPDTGEIIKRVSVRNSSGDPVDRLNELECLSNGNIAANVWMSNTIVEVDLDEGIATTLLDATDLKSEIAKGQDLENDDVLNGIAELPDGKLAITGKRWDTIFIVDVKVSGRSR